jgi:hypothetical protein
MFLRLRRSSARLVKQRYASASAFALQSGSAGSRRARLASNVAYVVPYHPKLTSAAAVDGIDVPSLWATSHPGPAPQAASPSASDASVGKVGTARVFYDTPKSSGDVTVISSLGSQFSPSGSNVESQEQRQREIVRSSVGSATKAIRQQLDFVEDVRVEASLDPHAAGMWFSLLLLFLVTHLRDLNLFELLFEFFIGLALVS